MPCHLCCRRKIDLVRIENWLLCCDCRRRETLDRVLFYLRSGDGLNAERVVRQYERASSAERARAEKPHGDMIAVVLDSLDENVGA